MLLHPAFPASAFEREREVQLASIRAQKDQVLHSAFYAGTAPENVDQVETELLREARLLREEGLTEAELNRAKGKVIGQKKIARQYLDPNSLVIARVLPETPEPDTRA